MAPMSGVPLAKRITAAEALRPVERQLAPGLSPPCAELQRERGGAGFKRRTDGRGLSAAPGGELAESRRVGEGREDAANLHAHCLLRKERLRNFRLSDQGGA